MSLAFVTKHYAQPISCSPGLEMAPGDQVRLTLDTSVDPELPVSIFGVVQTPVIRARVIDPNTGCVVNGYSYTFSYDTVDLNGALVQLTPDTILTVGCVPATEVLDAQIVALKAQIDAIEVGTGGSLMLVFAGDSTAALDTGTRWDQEPGAVPPYYGYPGPGPNPENWTILVRDRLKTVTDLTFGNIAVGGRTAQDVYDNFDVEIAPYIPEPGQPAKFVLVVGHNDIVNHGAPAAATYTIVQAIRAKAEALGFVCCYVPPMAHAANEAELLALTNLALFDIDNWGDGIIDQWGRGGNFPMDTIHQGTLASQTQANRYIEQVIEGKNLLIADVLTVGSGGVFKGVWEAMYYYFYRRSSDTSRPFPKIQVLGTVYSQNPGNLYGDGVWLFGIHPELSVEITAGSVLHVQLDVDYAANAPYTPSSLNISGPGTLILSAPGTVNFGEVPTRISCAVMDCRGLNVGPYGKDLQISSPLVLAGVGDVISDGLYGGVYYADAGGFGVTVGPGTRTVQSGAYHIINSRDGADPGVTVLQGCTFVREDGGAVERLATTVQASTGRVFFSGPSLVSDDTKTATHVWQGTQPGVIDEATPAKATPVGADKLLIGDSAAGGKSKEVTLDQIAATGPPGYTVATLPVGPAVMTKAYVTDALTPTYLSPVVGGGAVVCPVIFNGTVWVSA